MKSRLEQLAAGNDSRIAALKGRDERSRSRRGGKMAVCPACMQPDQHSYRSPLDICDDCLTALWNAESVLRDAERGNTGRGLKPYKMTNVYHHIDYAHLATHRSRPPKDADFARPTKYSGFSGTESSDTTIQMLFCEFFVALSELSACDPNSRAKAVPVLPFSGMSYSTTENTVFMFMPPVLAKAIRDLWQFFKWHSHDAYREGFEDGHNLLSRLNTGDLTHEGFIAETAEQCDRLQKAMERAKSRKKDDRFHDRG